MSASKREELVQNALTIFYEGGFNAIGMDRIAAETGVSKTSIYKHFRTKEDLILATLRLHDEQFRNWLVRRVEVLASEPAQRLLAVFDALREWLLEPEFRGCMFVKASAEFQDRASPIHAASAEHKRLLQIYFEKLADKAGAGHPGELAAQLQLLIEGAITIAHLHDPHLAAETAGAAARVLINAALPANAVPMVAED
ncbi:MAG: TetR/AcrR family transcriptional regulator [Hyphomonas sp.]|uniref:TetR/AcrR family transcriptional regulator n=1 Tax=Hyphomonas sp. TaxID=87 RepID=UPI0017AF54AB|nr:TetR/AcrR family transcriptional regulator [Hyphomonas sp.]MBA3067597.1 TetR/AcrR family transcriptional regulator [Hyphomonas sp.]MBU3921713.1 TetR/AcrR family transcriptional regulator [Alphaproteobacteria bacterium]MBU4063487.1 TetR/AcrR family transcriptional regulator [Alphaproteobacteria bacterium]MBU4165308.1 TetR/AcrR family transcriptional regulator [Alphaproteobacteria bacterium]